MKKFSLIIFSLIIFIFSRAQDYHPLVDTNKVWSTAHFYFPWYPTNSDFIKFQGDTTINGIVYKQVWKCNDTTQTSWTQYGYIREDNDKRVWYLSWSGGASNNLIYDFSVAAGDTVYLFYDPMGSFLVVDSTDTFTLLTGESRKRINLSCHFGEESFGNDTWIEGMGSLYGALQSGNCLLVGDNPQLICFTENDTLKYFNDNFYQCYVVTGINDLETNKETLEIFPNPSGGVITILLSDPSSMPVSIVFYDPAGRKILDKEIKGPRTTIDLKGFTCSSFVFYQVIGSKGFSSSGKIIFFKQ